MSLEIQSQKEYQNHEIYISNSVYLPYANYRKGIS